MMVNKKNNIPIKWVQSVLTIINWLPLSAAILFCILFKDVFLHENFTYRLFTFGVPPLISLFTCFGIATLCFHKGSRELSTVLFGLICSLWGLLSLDVALLIVVKDAEVALKISRLDHFFLVMQLGFYIHFLNHFAGINKKWVYLAYAISLFFAPVSQTDWYIKKMFAYTWGFFAEKNFMFDVFSLVAALAIILTGYVLVNKAFKTSDKLKKKQYLFFLAGSVGEVLLSLSNIPAMNGIDFYPCGSFIFIPVLLMAYGAFRHDIIKFNFYTKKKVVFRIFRLFTFSVYGLMAVVFVFFAGSYSNGYIISKVITAGIPVVLSFVLCLFFSGVATRLGQNRNTIRLFGILCLFHSFLCINFVTEIILADSSDILLLRGINYCLVACFPGLHLHFIGLMCQKKNNWHYIALSYFTGLLFSVFILWTIIFTPVHLISPDFSHRIKPALIIFSLIFFVNTVYCFKLLYLYRKKIPRPVYHWTVYYFISGFFLSAFFGMGNILSSTWNGTFPFTEYSFIPFSLIGYAVYRQSLNEVFESLNVFLQNIGRVLFLGVTALILYELKSVDLPFWYYIAGLLFWLLVARYGGTFFTALLAYVLDREKERLSVVLREISVELAVTQTVESVFKSLAKPLFEDISCLSFCVLLPEVEEGFLTGSEIVNDKNETLSPFSAKSDNSITTTQIIVPRDHKLVELSETTSELLPQAVFEELILKKNLFIPLNDRLRSFEILCPVFFNDKMSCLLALSDKNDGSDYSSSEMEFISKLALILGPYIENARLLTGLEKEVESRTHDLKDALSELTTVNSIVSTVNSTLDLDGVMPAFIRQLKKFVGFETVSIQLIDKASKELCLYRVYKKGLDDKDRKQLENLSVSLKEKNSLFLKAVEQKAAVYQNDYCIEGAGSDFDKKIFTTIPSNAILVLPMDFQNEVIGTIMLTSDSSETDYSKNDIERVRNYVTLIVSAVNNSRLYQSVESALSVKSDFIARMSHEIRTPLNAILAMSDLLDETTLSKEQKEYVSILKNTGSLLLRILSEVLDFSKLEAGKLKLNTAAFDLFSLLKDIEKAVSANLRVKKLGYKCIVENDLGSPLMGDSIKLAQVLINLITNSIKFTSEGGITVTVKHSSEPDMIEFSVEDTGVGIPPNDQPTIFDSFTQAHVDSTHLQGGSGLGLSISRKMIELMGGEIHLETCGENGSKFVFTACLPETSAPCIAEVPGVSLWGGTDHFKRNDDERTLSESEPSLQGVNALIVEDIYTNQVVIQKYLSSCGAIYETAESGFVALETFKKNKFDIVLMDIEMPGIDGFETAEKIRDWENANNLLPVPILGVSAHVQPEYVASGEVTSINDFLLKPYNKRILITKIKMLLKALDDRHVRVDACLAEVVPELITEIRVELETVLDSVANRDYNAIEILAHGLRGASFNCELRYLGELFNHLKESALYQNNNNIKRAIEKITAYIDSVNIEFVTTDLSNQDAFLLNEGV